MDKNFTGMLLWWTSSECCNKIQHGTKGTKLANSVTWMVLVLNNIFGFRFIRKFNQTKTLLLGQLKIFSEATHGTNMLDGDWPVSQMEEAGGFYVWFPLWRDVLRIQSEVIKIVTLTRWLLQREGPGSWLFVREVVKGKDQSVEKLF